MSSVLVHRMQLDVRDGRPFTFCVFCGAFAQEQRPGCTLISALVANNLIAPIPNTTHLSDPAHSESDLALAQEGLAISVASPELSSRHVDREIKIITSNQQHRDSTSSSPSHSSKATHLSLFPGIEITRKRSVLAPSPTEKMTLEGRKHVTVRNDTDRIVLVVLSSDPNMTTVGHKRDSTSETVADGTGSGFGAIPKLQAEMEFIPNVLEQLQYAAIGPGKECKINVIGESRDGYLTGAYESSQGGYRLLAVNRIIQVLGSFIFQQYHVENASSVINKWPINDQILS